MVLTSPARSRKVSRVVTTGPSARLSSWTSRGSMLSAASPSDGSSGSGKLEFRCVVVLGGARYEYAVIGMREPDHAPGREPPSDLAHAVREHRLQRRGCAPRRSPLRYDRLNDHRDDAPWPAEQSGLGHLANRIRPQPRRGREQVGQRRASQLCGELIVEHQQPGLLRGPDRRTYLRLAQSRVIVDEPQETDPCPAVTDRNAQPAKHTALTIRRYSQRPHRRAESVPAEPVGDCRGRIPDQDGLAPNRVYWRTRLKRTPSTRTPTRRYPRSRRPRQIPIPAATRARSTRAPTPGTCGRPVTLARHGPR